MRTKTGGEEPRNVRRRQSRHDKGERRQKEMREITNDDRSERARDHIQAIYEAKIRSKKREAK